MTRSETCSANNSLQVDDSGIAWQVILFIVGLVLAFFCYIMFTPMYNTVFDWANSNYVVTDQMSGANHSAGNVVYYAWLAMPGLVVIISIIGYILRALIIRGVA